MNNLPKYLETIGQITDQLQKEGFKPVLIGGMALVLLGSKRVTQDFDFLVSEELRNNKILLDILYGHGFELISKLNDRGEVIRTIDNKSIARIRLKIDAPKSAYFFHHQYRLRIDLLFDFPISQKEILAKAIKKKTRSYSFYIPSKKDLLTLKKIASKSRDLSSDQQDIEFLEKL